MSRKWKPETYSSVSPYLVVDGAKRVIDFLQETFGAKALRGCNGPEGAIVHAEVCIDDTVVMISDGGPNWPPYQSHLHVYVPDVDATYRRALKAGGVSVQEPQQRGDDPGRRCGVRDPGGNTWWIATQVE